MYLIETIVALILGAMLAYALLNMLSETMRLTSSNNNRQSADFMAETVLDAVKMSDSHDPSTWPIGSYQLLVNSTSPGQREAMDIHPLPIGLNIGDLNWTSKVQGNKFRGDVFLDILPGTSPNTKFAVVTAKWSDGSNYVGKKVGTLTLLHPRGVNYWP